MFQDINVAKSAPFALLTIYQKSLYPPKIFKMPPFWQITRNSPNSLILGASHVKLTKFALTANIAKFAQFTDTWCESREINQIRSYSKYRKIRPIR